MNAERLHNARLERERIIEEEQQLEQQTGHKATQQSDKLRSHSVTLPTSVNNNNMTVRSVMTNDATKGNKTTRKAVNSPRERFTKSDTLPVSDISRPSTSTRLPPAVMSLPEKVTPSFCNIFPLLMVFTIAGSEDTAGNGTEDEQ